MAKHRKPSPSLTNLAIIVVLLGWSANFTANLLSPDYESNNELDAMLLAVLGFLLAGRAAGNKDPAGTEREEEGEDKGPEEAEGGDKK